MPLANATERLVKVRKGHFPWVLAMVTGGRGECQCNGSMEEEAGLPWDEA